MQCVTQVINIIQHAIAVKSGVSLPPPQKFHLLSSTDSSVAQANVSKWTIVREKLSQNFINYIPSHYVPFSFSNPQLNRTPSMYYGRYTRIARFTRTESCQKFSPTKLYFHHWHTLLYCASLWLAEYRGIKTLVTAYFRQVAVSRNHNNYYDLSR